MTARYRALPVSCCSGLLLAATFALAFGPRLGPAIRQRFRAGIGIVLPIQFLLGMYGGYFGGAVGLMMVAAWSLLEDADLEALNAPRTLLVTTANTGCDALPPLHVTDSEADRHMMVPS